MPSDVTRGLAARQAPGPAPGEVGLGWRGRGWVSWAGLDAEAEGHDLTCRCFPRVKKRDSSE